MATRINSNGNLEILHDPTKSYVPAFVPIPASGGTVVSLSGDQLDLLSNINDALVYLEIFDEEFRELITSIVKSAEDPATGSKKYLQDLIAAVQLLSGRQSDIVQGLANVQNAVTRQTSFTSSPKIINLLVNANEERSFSIPAGTREFAWKCRGGSGDTTASIKYSYESGIVNSTNITSNSSGYYVLMDGQEETKANLNLQNNLTIYFFSTDQVWLSIQYWI